MDEKKKMMVPGSDILIPLSLIIILMFVDFFILSVSANNGSDPIFIMPLGDSITKGDNLGGYRRKLHLDLTNAGFYVDFVGSLQTGSASGLSFDFDHEGWGGWSAGQIASNVYDFLTSNPADIVLLHIGTNGLTESPDDVELILDEIDRYSEDVTVILARIINKKTYDPFITLFNDNVEDMANARILAGDDIVVVDMEGALTYPGDISDPLHPTPAGYEKMADIWYNAIYEKLTHVD